MSVMALIKRAAPERSDDHEDFVPVGGLRALSLAGAVVSALAACVLFLQAAYSSAYRTFLDVCNGYGDDIAYERCFRNKQDAGSFELFQSLWVWTAMSAVAAPVFLAIYRWFSRRPPVL